jgi:ABC-2 type transport system ATP-binding protein
MKSSQAENPAFRISLNAVSVRFRFQWVFKNLNLEFESSQSYALTGPNGAGKSTLLRILCGHLTPSKGTILFSYQQAKVPPEDVYRYISMTGPYMELIEEFSLVEAIRFHRRFKPFHPSLSDSDVLDLIQLPRNSHHKEIRFFSSGMKQRLKLALAVLSESRVLMVDEPSTNLDQNGIEWYHTLIRQYAGDRLLVVASNVSDDYRFCRNRIEIGAIGQTSS